MSAKQSWPNTGKCSPALRMNIRTGIRQQVLEFIRSHSYQVKRGRRSQVTSDADENKFLECADAARADYLLYGNQRQLSEVLEESESNHVARNYQHQQSERQALTGSTA